MQRCWRDPSLKWRSIADLLKEAETSASTRTPSGGSFSETRGKEGGFRASCYRVTPGRAVMLLFLQFRRVRCELLRRKPRMKKAVAPTTMTRLDGSGVGIAGATHASPVQHALTKSPAFRTIFLPLAPISNSAPTGITMLQLITAILATGEPSHPGGAFVVMLIKLSLYVISRSSTGNAAPLQHMKSSVSSSGSLAAKIGPATAGIAVMFTVKAHTMKKA